MNRITILIKRAVYIGNHDAREVIALPNVSSSVLERVMQYISQ